MKKTHVPASFISIFFKNQVTVMFILGKLAERAREKNPCLLHYKQHQLRIVLAKCGICKKFCWEIAKKDK
tara:strand:+ start:2244 stop:2453 length:210 start_codon:yes stop_codon:yes gene_type:complete